MRVKSLLAVAAVAATVAQASAFKVNPVSLYPNPSIDITDLYYLENLNFMCMEEGVKITEVMPAWVDEDGNEIMAVSGQQNPFGIEPNSFVYKFDSEAFKANGEYILLFPEGMLVNEGGEKSEKYEIPYTLDVPELAPAMFDDFKVLSVVPDLSKPQAIWNDQKITIDTNHNDAIGYTELQIIDTTTEESITISTNFTENRVLGDSSPISWDVIGSFKFFEGHNYKAELTFYNGSNAVNDQGVLTKIVDRATYEFTGLVEGYKYSSVELLSVDPAPYSTIISQPEQAVFTYTFSAPVKVYQAETPLGQNGKVVYPSSCLSSNEDKTVWTLDLSDNEYVQSVDAMLTIYVYAKDEDGYQLRGNWGEEGESCFMDEWQCDLGAFPIVTVTPSLGESIDCLSEVVVKAADGQPMSWSWNTEIYVKNQLGEILGTLVYDAPEVPEDSEDPVADSAMDEFRFTKWMDDFWNVTDIHLVKEGRYFIEIGPGCFLQGDQFESKQSKGLNVTFVVTGELDEPVTPVDPAEQEVFNYTAVDPEPGTAVKSLDVIKIFYPEDVYFNGCDVMVYDAGGELVAYTVADFDWDAFAFDYVLITMSKPIVEAGVYEVVVPARSFCNEEFANSDGEAGICNPEIRLTYTVDPDGSAVESVEAADADAVYYDLTGGRVVNPSKGIYVVKGRKVVIK